MRQNLYLVTYGNIEPIDVDEWTAITTPPIFLAAASMEDVLKRTKPGKEILTIQWKDKVEIGRS